jgi:dienelactone hydrolase
MEEALKKESVPAELVVIPGAAHGFNAEGNRKMYEAMLTWSIDIFCHPILDNCPSSGGRFARSEKTFAYRSSLFAHSRGILKARSE